MSTLLSMVTDAVSSFLVDGWVAPRDSSLKSDRR
jgi:hypothetical protein